MDFVNKLIALDEPVSWEEVQAQRRQNQQEAQTMFDNRRINQVRGQQVRDAREQRNWDIWNRTQGLREELVSARNKLKRWGRKRLAERRRKEQARLMEDEINEGTQVLEGAQILHNLSYGRPGLEALSELEPVIVPGEVVRVEGAPFRGVFY